MIITRDDAVIRPAIRALNGTERTRDEEAQIPLAAGMNLIRITPASATGEVEGQAESSVEIRVTRSAPVEGRTDPRDSGARGGRTLFLLSVGISRFSHPELDLKNAELDARSVAALMSVASPPVYDRAVTRMLLNESATVTNILSALADSAASAGPDDLVLIFFAGHGEQVDGKFYFAPSDFGMRDPATFARAMKEGSDGDAALNELFQREGLGQDRLLPMIQAIPAARVAIILDSCFSGSLAAGDAAMARNSNLTITNSIGHASGRFVLSSATRDALDFVPDGSADATPNGQ